jgi:hypothetical protein
MLKRKRGGRKRFPRLIILLAIISVLFVLFCSVFLFKETTKPVSTKNQTNESINITSQPFQENVSIEVPEGIVKIGKGRRIKPV